MEILLNKYCDIRFKIENDNNGHHKIGCLIFDKSYNICSFGYNKYNVDKFNRSLHAEKDAINKLKFNSKNKKVNVLIFRISNDNKNILLGLPCSNCKNSLILGIKNKGYNLKKIYYTDNEGIIAKLI